MPRKNRRAGKTALIPLTWEERQKSKKRKTDAYAKHLAKRLEEQIEQAIMEEHYTSVTESYGFSSIGSRLSSDVVELLKRG